MNQDKLNQIAQAIKNNNPEMSDDDCGKMAKEIVIKFLKAQSA